MGALLREISLRHIRHSPLRSLLVLFGIALGVAMLVATRAVDQSLLGAFHEMVGRVAGRADVVLTNGDVGVSSELTESIAAIDDVAHVAGSLEITTRKISGGGPLLVLGVDFLGDKHFLPFESAAGEDVVADPLSFVNDPTAILVARKMAEANHLKLDDTLELLTSEGPKTFHVRGILEDKGPTASFGGQVAVMFSEAAQVMFARGSNVDRIDVALKPGRDIEGAIKKLKALAGGRARVEKPEGRGQHLEAILAPYNAGIEVAGLISLLVGMFLIYNAVGVAVAQRRREIGVLRAIGVTRGRVVALFCLEAMMLAVLGGAVGVLLAGGLAEIALAQATPNVSEFYVPIRPDPPKITLELALNGILIGLFTTLVAAYWPARAAANVDPVETLRRRGMRGAAHLPWRRLLGVGFALMIPAWVLAEQGSMWLGFAAIGLLALASVALIPGFVLALRWVTRGPIERLFGIPGRLAIDNVERSLERSTLTVAALMIATGSSVCIGTWGRSLEVSILSWLDQAVPADVFVTAGSPIADQHNVPFKPEVIDKLIGLPGMIALQPVRIINQDVGELRIQLLSLDSRTYFTQLGRKKRSPRVVAGRDPIEVGALEEAPRIMLAENFARKAKLKPGDFVSFETPTGPHRFEVRAAVVDYTSDQGLAVIDRRYFMEYWGDHLIDTIDVYLEEKTDVTTAVAEIRRRIGDNAALFVTPAAALREEIRQILLQSIDVLRSTDIVALMVALLGVIGTMLAAVLDRIREIGILRAVGATRRQIAMAVVAESGFLGVASALAGVLLGIPMGLVFMRVVALAATGWRVEYSFPPDVAARIALTVALTAALAGLFPGRRAAQMDVTEALAYE